MDPIKTIQFKNIEKKTKVDIKNAFGAFLQKTVDTDYIAINEAKMKAKQNKFSR